MSTATPIRTATTEDRAAMQRCLGSAFLDDPVWLWLIGHHRMDERRAGRAIAALGLAHLGDGLTTITADGSALAVWAAPKRFRITPRQFLPHLPGLVRAMGIAGMRRLLLLEEMERLHPAEPHYYLALLGTHRDHQGRGLGSAVLQPMLERADAEGVPCYLESSKESNIAFYRRHRFEVTGEFAIDDGSGPTSYLMWRDPQPPGTR